MNIADIKHYDVQIQPDKIQRYLHLRTWSKSKGGLVVLLLGDPLAEKHKDILPAAQKAGFETRDVEGGGKIDVITDAHEIYAWDDSADFGRVSWEDVIPALQMAFPGFIIYPSKPSPNWDTQQLVERRK